MIAHPQIILNHLIEFPCLELCSAPAANRKLPCSCLRRHGRGAVRAGHGRERLHLSAPGSRKSPILIDRLIKPAQELFSGTHWHPPRSVWFFEQTIPLLHDPVNRFQKNAGVSKKGALPDEAPPGNFCFYGCFSCGRSMRSSPRFALRRPTSVPARMRAKFFRWRMSMKTAATSRIAAGRYRAVTAP